MNRRGFLSGFGAAGAVGMAAPALAIAKDSHQGGYGFYWTVDCPNKDCKKLLSQFIDMSGPLKIGTQCPKCLFVLDTTTLAEQIRFQYGKDLYGRPLECISGITDVKDERNPLGTLKGLR